MLQKKSVLIFISAKDFNEEEFLTVKYILEKGGINLFITSDANGLCEGKNGLKVKADVNLWNIHTSNFQAFVLIGGNTKIYWQNKTLHQIIKKFSGNKKLVAAICNAAVIVAKAGVLQNIPATCYPENKAELLKEGIEYKEIPVVVKKNFITGNGPQASSEFARAILDKLLQ